MRSRTSAVLAAACALMLQGVAAAQVEDASDEDIKNAPPQFRSEMSGGRIKPAEAELARGAPAGSEPQSADPRDFNGIYSRARGTPINGLPGAGPGAAPPAAPPPRPAAAGAPRGPRNVGEGACLPAFQNIGSYSTMIVQNPQWVVLVMEENHGIRLARMDGSHPDNLRTSYSGHSVAKWDGDVLVIDTVAIKDARGGPAFHVTERLRKTPGGMEVVTTTFDKDGKGVDATSRFNWRPDLKYVEDICEDFGEAFGVGYD